MPPKIESRNWIVENIIPICKETCLINYTQYNFLIQYTSITKIVRTYNDRKVLYGTHMSAASNFGYTLKIYFKFKTQHYFW